MPLLSKLLDIQDLDFSADDLLERRRTLPERAALVESRAEAVALDQAFEVLEGQRGALRADEQALGDEVAVLAAKAKEVEDTLYSGSVKAPKELEGLQEEIRLLKEKQGGLEDRELELMEQIESVEAEMVGNREQRAASDARQGELGAAISSAEGEISGQLAEIGASRAKATPEIPELVMEKYGELRSRERLRGRAAGRLEGGSCQSCRMKLPVLEHKRIQDQPPDALVRCVHCGRILVR
jgi:predicted  nucleic acid-binding Zn-ribbon protein